jgi:hypothetical protein
MDYILPTLFRERGSVLNHRIIIFTSKYTYIVIDMFEGRATAQAVSRWFLTEAALVQTRV